MGFSYKTLTPYLHFTKPVKGNEMTSVTKE